MATAQLETAPTERNRAPTRFFPVVMSAVFAGYAAGLGMMLTQRAWILAPSGRPVPCDFLAFWVAGKMALAGNASSAYDPNALHAAQAAVAGPFDGYLYWNYPPFFFFFAVLLSASSYVAAFLGWVVATVVAFAITIGTIARRWEGALAACASPVILLGAFGGQNGFLSAALLGGSLLLIPARPILAGILLGLMAYKPQFGILIPVALIAGGHWRAIFSAGATVAMLVGASLLVFGWSANASFLHFLPHAYSTLGGEGWAKVQSIYSVARYLGAGDSSAWLAQAATVVACAVVIAFLWRSGVAYELKAAALAVAVLLSTPYVHIYDFPVLLVALAFLYRHRPFDRIEWSVAIAVNLLLLVFLAQIAPIGPGIEILVGIMIPVHGGMKPMRSADVPRASEQEGFPHCALLAKVDTQKT
jgi:hypothetical protein